MNLYGALPSFRLKQLTRGFKRLIEVIIERYFAHSGKACIFKHMTELMEIFGFHVGNFVLTSFQFSFRFVSLLLIQYIMQPRIAQKEIGESKGVSRVFQFFWLSFYDFKFYKYLNNGHLTHFEEREKKLCLSAKTVIDICLPSKRKIRQRLISDHSHSIKMHALPALHRIFTLRQKRNI